MFSGVPSEQLLESLREADDAGREVVIAPPMTTEEIIAIERQVDFLLPLALRDLFRTTAGFAVDGFHVDFCSKGIAAVALSHMLPIATERELTWVIGFDQSGWCPVLCISARPAVIAIQSGSITEFIQQVFAAEGPAKVIAPFVAEIAKSNPHARTARSLVGREDPVLAAFARELQRNDLVTDLRARRPGVGFAWDSASPIRRAGRHLIFATRAQRLSIRHLLS